MLKELGQVKALAEQLRLQVLEGILPQNDDTNRWVVLWKRTEKLYHDVEIGAAGWVVHLVSKTPKKSRHDEKDLSGYTPENWSIFFSKYSKKSPLRTKIPSEICRSF